MIAHVKSAGAPPSSTSSSRSGWKEPATAWGLLGEVRFDRSLIASPLRSDVPGFHHDSVWRAPDGCATIQAWGPPRSTWHCATDRGLIVVADATLYADPLRSSDSATGPHGLNAAQLLAAAYQRWGEQMCDHLDGDFAFVILDLRANTAFAAVDPMGVRPLLFRHVADKYFMFSTSAEALATCAGLDARIPESRLLEPLLNLEELRHFRSDIPGLKRLQAGHACRVDAKQVRSWRYWTAGRQEPGLRADDLHGWIEALRDRLQIAVRRRMADGARVGVMFSGGLDSASVLALATRFGSASDITAYSLLDRSTGDCPETRAIDRMIAATGARIVPLDVANMQEHIEPGLRTLARVPRFDYIRNGFLPYLSSIAAASGVVAMMNGYDADSMFSEADLLRRHVRAGQFRRALLEAHRLDRGTGVPDFVPQVRRMRLLRWLPTWAEPPLREFWHRSRSSRTSRDFLLDPSAARRLQLAERMHEYHQLTRRTSDLRGPALPSSLMQIPTVIDGVARCEMRFRLGGVQMRSPFLDRDLIDFAAWIPLELRLRKGRYKWILRKAMAPYLPHGVTWRRDKLHLGSHYARVLLRPVLDKVLRDFAGTGPAIARYVDRPRFEAEARRWLDGDISAVWALHAWLALEHWLQHNQDRVAWGL